MYNKAVREKSFFFLSYSYINLAYIMNHKVKIGNIYAYSYRWDIKGVAYLYID